MIEFFDGAEIFITGGSGAVGKAFIEKLLRSCNVKRIYLLLRPKKNRLIQERIAALKKEKIFMRVLREKPNCFDRIEGIPGDVVLPMLGISSEDFEKLKNVTLFYHSAATIRFDESLKLALTVNVGGTHEALLLAEKLQKLKLFMYVSTFFSNPYLEHVEEKVYPTPMNWNFALERVKDVDADTLLVLTKKIITGFPNTYCFTKNLSESMVNDFRYRVPVTIYRPSIVIQALSEPEPGYPSALIGVLGLFTLYGCGVLKAAYMDKHSRLDMTPLDICAKTMLYYTIRARRFYDEVKIPRQAPVYLVTSEYFITKPLKELYRRIDDGICINNAFEKNLLIPGVLLTESYILYTTSVFLKQLPVGILADLLLRLFGIKPVLMKIMRIACVTLQVMDPFMSNNYTSHGITHIEEMIRDTENTPLSIGTELEKTQTEDGLCTYMNDMLLGIRTHLLNENPDTIERSKRIIKMKIFVYNIIRGVFYGMLLTWLYGKLFH